MPSDRAPKPVRRSPSGSALDQLLYSSSSSQQDAGFVFTLSHTAHEGQQAQLLFGCCIERKELIRWDVAKGACASGAHTRCSPTSSASASTPAECTISLLPHCTAFCASRTMPASHSSACTLPVHAAPACSDPNSLLHAAGSRQEGPWQSNQPTEASRVFCVLSAYPFFDLHFGVLK